jgi:transcriptional regulator with XRE-family HTH domain
MKQQTLSDALRRAIRNSGQTVYAIAQQTGVSRSMLGRFVAGKSDLTLGRAEPVARLLGLALRQSGQ